MGSEETTACMVPGTCRVQENLWNRHSESLRKEDWLKTIAELTLHTLSYDWLGQGVPRKPVRQPRQVRGKRTVCVIQAGPEVLWRRWPCKVWPAFGSWDTDSGPDEGNIPGLKKWPMNHTRPGLQVTELDQVGSGGKGCFFGS